MSLLEILRLKPSARSIDFVKNKTQFQLHKLITEQRHLFTWNLSQIIKEEPEQGLRLLLAVDNDITKKLISMAQEKKTIEVLEKAAETIVKALEQGGKIFFYGCGSTGRLAKFMESCLWRPFWRKLKKQPRSKRLLSNLPDRLEERLIGEMTGGDRALISALEGFEDLQLLGRLQVAERKVQRGDVVFCITEGGETSSVIGAMLAAVEMWNGQKPSCSEARKHLYFVYNNPEDVLMPLERSQAVLNHPAITKICLVTGAQAITGSTRMQATTIETYVLGLILERAISLLISKHGQKEERAELGFKEEVDLKKELANFAFLPASLISRAKEIASLTALEAKVYEQKRRSTYFAKKALLTVFIDGAERSPTFHLRPLDPITEKKRRCLFQVWTEARDYRQAWKNLLGRKFRGLDRQFYESALAEKVSDPYLREVALKSLLQAGNEQQDFYDLSFSERNIARGSPRRGDLSVMVGLNEEIEELKKRDSSWKAFARLSHQKGSYLALVFTGFYPEAEFKEKMKTLEISPRKEANVYISLPPFQDPLGLRQQILLKMLLNAHSTGVMALLGRIVGNTMTSVNPTNLKLIGRATFLLMSHVNDVISSSEWRKKYGEREHLTYAEANALLFDCLEQPSCLASGKSEVELSIIRALEALKQFRFVSWEQAIKIANSKGIENYLCEFNPRLRSA